MRGSLREGVWDSRERMHWARAAGGRRSMRVEVVSKMDWSMGGLVAREGERRRVERARSRLVGGVVVLLGWWWRMVKRRRMLSLG